MKPFYERTLNPITMWHDSKFTDSVRESNLRGAKRNRIKKSISSYKKTAS